MLENARFSRNNIQVIAVHVVGSNNNFEARDPAAAAEFFARDKANRAWLGDSFDKAIRENAKAVVLGLHADMFRYDFNLGGKEKFLRHSGFKNFAELLIAKATAFGKPVLLIYGDTHQFMVTRTVHQNRAQHHGIAGVRVERDACRRSDGRSRIRHRVRDQAAS